MLNVPVSLLTIWSKGHQLNRSAFKVFIYMNFLKLCLKYVQIEMWLWLKWTGFSNKLHFSNVALKKQKQKIPIISKRIHQNLVKSIAPYFLKFPTKIIYLNIHNLLTEINGTLRRHTLLQHMIMDLAVFVAPLFYSICFALKIH